MRYLIAIAFILTAVALATAADPKAPAFEIECSVASVYPRSCELVVVARPPLGNQVQPYFVIPKGFGDLTVDGAKDLIYLLGQGKAYIEDTGERGSANQPIVKLWLKLPNQGWLLVGDWLEAHGHLRTPRTAEK